MSLVEGMNLERVEPEGLVARGIGASLTFYRCDIAPLPGLRSEWTWHYAVGDAGALQLLRMNSMVDVARAHGLDVSLGFGWDGGIHRRVDQGDGCPVPELDGHCDFEPNGRLGWDLGALIDSGLDVWDVLAAAHRFTFGA